jgi:hypothetical protein
MRQKYDFFQQKLAITKKSLTFAALLRINPRIDRIKVFPESIVSSLSFRIGIIQFIFYV